MAENWRIYATALPEFKALPDISDIHFNILWNPGKGFRFEPDIGQFEDGEPESPWDTTEQAFKYLIANSEDDEELEMYVQFLEKYAHTHLGSLKAGVKNHR